MTPAALTLTAAAVLLLASASNSRANVEAGEGDYLPSIDLSNFTDRAETLYNTMTEQAANVPLDAAAANINAFLVMLRQSEGTQNEIDPYRVCFAYKNEIHGLDGVSGTFDDWIDHPAITGEWKGERLPDKMCANAGFGPGCVSTAAGAYQIIKGTWKSVRDALNLPDFSPASQDAAAVELLRRRAALEDVKAGRIAAAITKCRNEWASLPGNYAKQGQNSQSILIGWYQQNGGLFA